MMNILAITPESALSMLVIGHARDLRLYMVVERDGQVCKSWCDTHVSNVYKWHIQHVVEQQQVDYDPCHKWGLKLLEESGAMYLVSGHIIHARRVDLWDSLFVSENIGCEGQVNTVLKELVAFEGSVHTRYAGLRQAMSGALCVSLTPSEYTTSATWEDGGECAVCEAASRWAGYGSTAALPLEPPTMCMGTPCMHQGTILVVKYSATLQRAGCTARGHCIRINASHWAHYR
ncbi:hypothetical protein DFH08DRAFT_804778 [Mycena albidolilacea]|uniref:Uncharacterized protein n=1 Tax=Mycena albidolilacea TaxID=1033008 RepID=A0AAD7AAP4_9AGAR|nr:hypothetical protein DFH08DRAFT_804778 [Mycena albidolilacea]